MLQEQSAVKRMTRKELVIAFEQNLKQMRAKLQQLAEKHEIEEINYDIIEAGYEELCDMMESLVKQKDNGFNIERFIFDNQAKVDIVHKLCKSPIMSEVGS